LTNQEDITTRKILLRLLIKIIDQSERRSKEDSKEPYVKGNLKEATFTGGSMELHGTLL